MIETIIEVKPVFFIVTDLTPKCPAHDGQEPQQAKAVADSRIPFSMHASKQFEQIHRIPETTPDDYYAFRLSAA
ncbi:MAG TPA: hypothetical protein VF305_03800 [Smithellaceae bacterium]